MHDKIIKKLQELTKHENVVLTHRGNASIRAALIMCKKKKVLIPDQGGWITYKQYPPKLGKELIEVKTTDGLLDLDDLKEKVDSDSVLLYSNPGGYFVEEPIKEIYSICSSKGGRVILDVSGGIGTDMCDGRYADIIVGSFGKWKPVNVEYGGFISCDNNKCEHLADLRGEVSLDETKFPEILEKLEKLPERIQFLNEKRDKIIEDLKDFDIVHPNSRGYVVVVKGDDNELEKVKKYCNENGLAFTECPRYIRINSKAISIEVKRL